MKRSKATVSRDFQLVRRIHIQFGRMFGRRFEVKKIRSSGLGTGLIMVFEREKAIRQSIAKRSVTFPLTREQRLLKKHSAAYGPTHGSPSVHLSTT
jgi:hypothetical protein